MEEESLLLEKELYSKRYTACVYVLTFLSIMVVSLSLPCVQILDDIVPKFELNSWRFMAQLTLLIPVVGWNKSNLSISMNHWPVLLVLFIDNALYNLLFFWAAIYLPVGTLMGMNQTTVLVVNVMISIFRVSDRKVYLYVSSTLCIMSCLFITQQFIFRV